MPQKTKFIIFGLAVLLLFSLFFNLQLYNSKQKLEAERQGLKKEGEALQKKINASLADNRRMEEKIAALNQDLERLSSDKEGLQRNLDLLKEERESLVERLKEQSAAAKKATPPEGASAAPKTEDIFWANLLKRKADLEIQLENIRGALNTLKVNNDQLQREKASLELELGNLKTENQDQRRQLEYNQKVVDSITKELVLEKNDKFEIDKNFKSLKEENRALRQQLKNLLSNKASLERKFSDLQNKYGALEDNLSKMDTLLKDKMLQVDALQSGFEQAKKGEPVALQEEKKDSVELPPIVVRPQKEAQTTAQNVSLNEGKVLLVNRDNNFIIINLGEDAQVRVGDTFEVLRNDKLIANVEAVQTRRSISACDIKKEITPIKVGDIVR